MINNRISLIPSIALDDRIQHGISQYLLRLPAVLGVAANLSYSETNTEPLSLKQILNFFFARLTRLLHWAPIVPMETRFLLGPSGSGKTFRCIQEVREELLASPAGPPLVFLAPKQATFQVERALLADSRLGGYTRLRILSFERLAEFILTEFRKAPPTILSEEGRIMVLRALLARKRHELKLFRATARLRGFAQQLSVLLKELQRSQLSPNDLIALAERVGPSKQLNHKLHDLASILQAYLDWLDEHDLEDDDRLLSVAAEILRQAARSPSGYLRLHLGGLWLDGFAQMAPQEIDLLASLLPCCERAVLAFNMDRESLGGISWLSTWSVVSQTYRQLHQRFSGLPGVEVITEWLDRDTPYTRFAQNRVLQHLEKHWSVPIAYFPPVQLAALEEAESAPDQVAQTIRVAACADPEAEAILAAREIFKFVRNGGRYREVAILVRQLDDYYDPVRRVLSCYEIPFFLDRREPVGHHPLSELTRNALRTIAYHWQPEDWFGALKTGLVHQDESEIDRLENETLARGWKGDVWKSPLVIDGNPELTERLEELRTKIIRPFQQLAFALGNAPTGVRMAASLHVFWQQLNVGNQLQDWSLHSGSVLHTAFWEQMQDWLDNLALAFADEPLPLREWLPIIEAGLSSQTVGVIPPALDQVLVGAIDRSRNPDLKLALILGVNESVFPAVPQTPSLLTDSDREELSKFGHEIGATSRSKLGFERYFGYIACTRSRERLVISYSLRDENDKPLNPSPFITHLQRLFPKLAVETLSIQRTWLESDHAYDLIEPVLHNWRKPSSGAKSLATLIKLAAFDRIRERLDHLQNTTESTSLLPALAEKLYGTVLETSVSRLEEFAACPFRFFVSSGLKAEERKLFELDVKEQGSFQHEVLARFHQQLKNEGKRWRDITPEQARNRIERIAENLIPSYRDGLLQSTDQSHFTATSLKIALQSFIETIVGWMEQYQFDPAAVELAFGIEEKPLPAWEIDLGKGHRLSFRGKIDRVDLWPIPGTDEAYCVVIDYKSSARKLDPILMAHGVQLQLPGYLNVLRSLPNPEKIFGVRRLLPAGVFFVNLRGEYEGGQTRRDVLDQVDSARKSAYRHSGRFDAEVLPKLDCRKDANSGDQFNYRLTSKGKIHGACREVMNAEDFSAMLDMVEVHLRRMGQAIFDGAVKIDPYQKGANDVACNKCHYQSICRIDPWTHQFRILRKPESASNSALATS